MKIARALVLTGALTAGTAAFACGGGGDSPNAVSVTASEYKFDVSGDFKPGTNEITLKNSGKEDHHLQLVKLEQGKTLNDVKALPPEASIPDWAKLQGGVTTVAAGKQVTVTEKVAEGHYALLCFVSGQDNVPHYAKGMASELDVKGDENKADVPSDGKTISATEYAFKVDGTVKAGDAVSLLLKNDGKENHEVELFRLPDGLTLDQVKAIISGDAPPPPGLENGPPSIGGPGAIPAGATAAWKVKLDKGSYVLACFVPGTDGQPHAAKGMLSELKVE